MPKEELFSQPLARSALATVGVLLASLLVTTGMAAYLPTSQVNQVVLPIIAFPVTWLLLFLWATLDTHLWRASVGLLLLSLSHLLLILRSVGKL
ncbi:MAG: hypothetical protein Cons2KO_10860 [Congregibacter sp.]